jgi:hypothetical protein
VRPAAQSHPLDRRLPAARDRVHVIELLWNDPTSRHLLRDAVGARCGSGASMTTDGPGRFDDVSVWYSRVAPVSRSLAA